MKSHLISSRDILTYIPFTKRRKDFLTTLNRLDKLDEEMYHEVIRKHAED